MNKKYEIWSEGYSMNSDQCGATKLGEIDANNFQQACDSFFKGDKLYNPSTLTYWSCKLFDNQEDARKSFG